MTAPNRNTLWARTLVDELVRAGVRDFCVAPGSRSTPLVLAASRMAESWEDREDREGGAPVDGPPEGSGAEHEGRPVRVRVFLDERSAAFFALGLGKGRGMPAVVITTSGTAVANLVPAAVEAHQAEVPLILLTADRPHHLRDADANQAIRQPGIFSPWTREAWDLPLAAMESDALRHLRAVGVRAVAAALGDPAGPVHVNVPFRKPLEPVEVPGDVPPELATEDPVAVEGRSGEDDRHAPPLVEVSRRRSRPTAETVEALARRVALAERPVLVVGPHPRPEALGEAAIRLAAVAGMPLLADPLSGARTGPDHGATRITAYDLFLRNGPVGEALAPDLVVRAGAAPTSGPLLRWLRGLDGVEQIVVDAGARWKDHQNVATQYVQADAVATFEALSMAVDVDSRPRAGWRKLWEAVDDAALTGALGAPGPRHEGIVAREVVEAMPRHAALFVSSSMPVRDVDAFGGIRQDPVPIHGNRGASGIDGIVSTAAGLSAALGRRVVVLLGDLAFLHDSNGLLAVREEDVELTLVVVNNDGGGIFHMLPIREHDPPFTRLFATPHGLDLAHLAALHGIPHRRLEDLRELRRVLEPGLAGPGSRVIEIVTDREENRVGHEAAAAAAMAAARDVLDNFGESES